MDMNSFEKASTELATIEPEVIIPEVIERNGTKDITDDTSVSAGGVAVKAGDVAAKVTVGTGDIHNNKSVGENMTVSGGTVNLTVNNDNSKTVTKASRFNKLPDAPAVPSIEAKDKGESLSM